MSGKLSIGTSGYSYDHWSNGVFYPPKLSRNKWLEHYAGVFDCVELNVTFYRLPRKEIFQHWHERTPPSFRFAVKGSRYITHVKRLKDIDEALVRFFDSAAGLADKLAAVLWQMPPAMKADPARLESFCRSLKLNKSASTKRHVFEFRNDTWFQVPVYEILTDNNYALCFADSPLISTPKQSTADFSYYRFHGNEGLYQGKYGRADLLAAAAEIDNEIREQNKDVFVFFNNDAFGFAVENALDLKRMVEKKEAKK